VVRQPIARTLGERLVLIERPSLVADFPTEVQPKATVRLTPSLSDSLPSSIGATRAAWFQYVQSAVALPEDDEVYPASVVACSPSLLALRRLEVSSGRLLVHRDDSTPVCVLGSSIARSLFGSSDPLGRTVYIGSPTPFTVVGVLEPTPRGVLDLSFDREDSIFIPPLSMLLIPDLSDRFCEDSKILLETRADEDPAVLVERARAYFSSELPAFTPPLVDKYLKSVERMDVLQAKINKVFALTGTLALILAAAGVFTIMTARVTERARDIAIRRAVGASKSGIIKLYLGESLRICLLGACFGFITAQPLLHLLEPSVPLSLGNLLSLAASATAGGIAAAIAGGLHPAISAARKPPAEAVRL
jgi:putative ABC transport system permease protein